MKKTSNILVCSLNPKLIKYLKNLNDKKINFIFQTNGKAANHLAFELIPDLVIAENLLHDQSGIQLCHNIKFDFRTKHIPFIFITNQQKKIQKITGIETQPDLIFIENFAFDDLIFQMNNLLIQNQELRYDEWIEESALLKLDKEEQQFLSELRMIFEQELANDQFDVNLLAEKMHLSRMQLYRKIKKMWNDSPGNLIKKRRLLWASKLLKTSSKSISEIAYTTGFSNPSYFSSCFKNFFHCSPGDYRK